MTDQSPTLPTVNVLANLGGSATQTGQAHLSSSDNSGGFSNDNDNNHGSASPGSTLQKIKTTGTASPVSNVIVEEKNAEDLH